MACAQTLAQRGVVAASGRSHRRSGHTASALPQPGTENRPHAVAHGTSTFQRRRPAVSVEALQQGSRPHRDQQPSRSENQALPTAVASTPQTAVAAGAAAAAAVAPAAEAAPGLLPKLTLVAAAAMWGSYAPSVRLLYESAGPPDAVVVMAVRGVLQAGVLLAVSLALQPQTTTPSSSSGNSSGSSSSAEAERQQQQQQEDPDSGAQLPLLERWLHLRSPPLWMAALELGLWNYSATALQTFGLQLTSATRASFLIQATVLLTPVLSTLAGYRPGRQVWAGCALALAGCLLITADEAAAEGSAAAAAAGFHFGGDSAILAAALFYSLAVVRMTGYAQSLPSVQIATGKSVVLGSLAIGSLLVAATSLAADGQQLTSLWTGWSDRQSWLALLWAGLGPGALGSYLHVQGQKHVAPAEAQIIFSSKPLWAASLAWFLLGGEELGLLTWIGGGTLVAAGLVASMPASQQQQTEPQAAAQQAVLTMEQRLTTEQRPLQKVKS